VEEESYLESSRPKVVVQLVSSRSVKVVGGFGLYNETLVDDHVEPLPSKLFALVLHLDVDFPGNLMAPVPELPLECRRVEILCKPESQLPIDLVERTDDGMRELFFE
jgi:hypothetical protein